MTKERMMEVPNIAQVRKMAKMSVSMVTERKIVQTFLQLDGTMEMKRIGMSKLKADRPGKIRSAPKRGKVK